MAQDIILKGKLKSYTRIPLLLTLLFAAMDVWMYFLNTMAGILCTAFVAVYFVVVLIVYRRNKPIILNELIDFATQYGTVQKRLLDEFEIPYAMMDHAGKLLWMNKQFSELSGKEKSYHKSVATIFPQITRELLEKEELLELQIEKDERVYRASICKIHFAEMLGESSSIETGDKEQFLLVMYLFDETMLTKYRIENQEMQMVPALVYIDNYDEVLDSVEEVKQSLLVALVDRKVNKFFSNVDGLVKKTEKDKYFVVFQHKYLAAMEEEKFSLLEEVKTIKVGNEMSVTLSMGIGYVGNDYTKKLRTIPYGHRPGAGTRRRSGCGQDNGQDILFRRQQPSGRQDDPRKSPCESAGTAGDYDQQGQVLCDGAFYRGCGFLRSGSGDLLCCAPAGQKSPDRH